MSDREKPLTVTVRPSGPVLGFSQALTSLFENSDRISVKLTDAGIVLGCIWHADLDEASNRIRGASATDLHWTEPRINYILETVTLPSGRLGEILLEPILRVEVHTPDDFSGTVIGDLSSRRGRIQGMEDDPVGKKIWATVPLGELSGYVPCLARLTGGSAHATATLSGYEQGPDPNVPDPDEPMSAALRA